MKEHPILFNTEMVRAILDGRKTQTRRLVKPQPPDKTPNGTLYDSFQKTTLPVTEGYDLTAYIDNPLYIGKCPFGQIGDQIWVRETWNDYANDIPLGYILYKADMPMHWNAKDTEHGEDIDLKAEDFKWKPSIHMPREASRINLEITDIRVEIVRSITYIEAKAEGINYERGYTDPRDAFKYLWDSIYKNWNDNPWVWVVEFKVI